MTKTTTEIVTELVKYLDIELLSKTRIGTPICCNDMENLIKEYLLDNQIGMIDHKG